MRTAIIIIIILVTTFFDALRDLSFKNWWRRHIVKWIQFYLPLIYLMTMLNWYWWIILPVIVRLIRQETIKMSGKNWQSIWLKLIEMLGKLMDKK